MNTNIIRVGRVSDISPDTGRVRVAFLDISEMVSDWLPVLGGGFKGFKVSCIPDIGEMVLVGSLPHSGVNKFVLGGFPTEEEGPPEGAAPGIVIIDFLDGTRLEYDRNKSELTATVKGKIDLTANDDVVAVIEGRAEITAAEIILKGDVTILGNLIVSGDVTNGGNIVTGGTHTDSKGTHYTGGD